MNKTLIAAAVLATLGSTAFAQSTVQIYGRLNLTVERQKLLGETDWVLQNSASRWGMKGSEDLGGGLKAGFQLESGFNPANGTTAARFFARQSEVNLGGGFGMVRLGNFTSEAYYATSDYIGMHNHETGTSADAFYAYVGRNTGKVAYRTPNFGGATAEIAITEAGTDPDRTIDFAVNYDAGPLHLGFGYERGNLEAKQFAGRVLYELGAFTIGATVQRDTDGWGAGFGDRTNYRVAGMYTIGNTELHLNVGRTGAYDNGPDSASQVTLGVNYNLSKRTKVYSFFTKLRGDGADFYAVNSTGVNQSLAVGVRHNF